jgi:hypothetical protein
MKTLLLKTADILRMLLVALSIYIGYSIGYAGDTYDPVAQLHFMIPAVIVTIAGISGLEGLFFAKHAAELKGFETGSNYQRQSAIALLSYAAVAVFAYLINWGIKAELTIFFAFIFFFIFSAINHGLDAISRKNYKWQNINRPLITLLLVAAMIHPVAEALKTIQ